MQFSNISQLGEEHDKTVRLFACDISEHVLHFFEDKFSEDERPRAERRWQKELFIKYFG